MPSDCIFCRILQGEIPGEVLYRDDRCFVIRDINPRAPVHLLVVPTEHFVFADDHSEAAEPMIGRLFTVAQQMARTEGIFEPGYRLAVNQGDEGGQTIDHLHLHVLGGRRLGPEG